MHRRRFSASVIGSLAAAGLAALSPARGATTDSSAIGAIRRWVVVMFENRSFDALLGHLPHIPLEDGLIGREVALAYPGGTLRIHPARNFTDPIPDPGEGYPNMNVQLFGRFDPPSNAGRAAFPIFPDFMSPPFNAPAPGQQPSMDGFALDYFHNARWQLGRDLSDAEMQSLGGVFTPETAPVINALARNFAVFTNGRIDNEITYDYSWDNDLPNIFTRLQEAGRSFTCYFPESQVVPLTAINLAGLRHLALWRSHSAYLTQFYADCRGGTLPDFSWVEPKMMFGETEDYHPPTDTRAAERFLGSVYEAVRASPQWEETALVILFDESSGCYDHVPPPAAVPRRDRVEVVPLPFAFGVAMPDARQAVQGDLPNARMLEDRYAEAAGGHLSEIGEATCRNAARLLGLDAVPRGGAEVAGWLARHFRPDGELQFPAEPRG